MELILIAAMAKNRIIGRNNTLPWRIPEELQLFKKTTMGYPMIMGRKTFESFPAPLPGRRHIILSRNPKYSPPGGEVVDSLESAISLCQDVTKVFIIGGAQIFRQAIPIVDTLLLTLLERDVEGDASFPEFSDKNFLETNRKYYPDGSEPFTVITYTKC